MCRGVESGFLDAYQLSILKGQQGNGKFYVHTHTIQPNSALSINKYAVYENVLFTCNI